MSSKALDPQVVIAEFARVVYQHTPSDDVALQDVLEPAYWSHVANKFKPGSRIEVVDAKLTWFADLIVLDAGRAHARVAVLSSGKIAAPKFDKKSSGPSDHEEGGYVVEFAGTNKKYRVIRKSDKKELKDNLATEDLGWEFVRNHIKALSM